ncbi:hypothetical protein Tco_1061284, partial [Tanacetum coccineum]
SDSRDEAGFGREVKDGLTGGDGQQEEYDMETIYSGARTTHRVGDGTGWVWSILDLKDPMRRLCHRMIACTISGRGQGQRRHIEGMKSGARLSRGHFIGRLADHFVIDLHELARLKICGRFGDTWSWVAPGPERQQAAAAGAHEDDEAGPAMDEGTQDVPASEQAPPPPPPAPQPRTMSQRIERIEEEIRYLRHDVVGLRGVVESFTTEQSRVSTWLISFMTQLMDTSSHPYQPFDSTHVVSSQMPY